MSKRAVLYARVSTDEQGKGFSLPTQLEACREYAEEHGFTVAGKFADEFTGTSLDRPGLDQLRDLIANDTIEAVIIYDLDRLSRRAIHQMLLEEEFARAGVETHYVLGQYDNTPEGRLQKQIKGAIAEYERAKIEERLKRGLRGKARAGYVIVGHNRPYGYNVVREPHKAWLTINEEEAKVVKLIYRWYVYGDEENGPLPIRNIAKRLTDMKIPTRSDKQGSSPKTLGYGEWSASSVRCILSNETYCGTWHYCKRLNVDGKPVKRPRKEWIPVEVPAIISKELWGVTQRQLRLNRERARRNTKHSYLLQGLLRCGQCGYRLLGGGQTKTQTGKIYYYRCGKKNTIYGDQRCRSRYVNSGVADTKVWEAVEAILLNPDALMVGLQQRQVEAERANQSLQERLELIRDGIADCERQLARLLDLYLSDRNFPEGLLEERRKALERQKAELEHERDDLAAKLKKHAVTDATIEEVKAFCEQVAKGLDNVDFGDRRRVLELLDVQGTVIEEDGGQKIVLTGAFPQKREASIETSILSRGRSPRRG